MEVLHRRDGGGVAALAADRIVGVGVDAVQADLHIDVVHRCEAFGGLGRDLVGRWSRT